MKAIYETKIEQLYINFDSALSPTPHLHKEIELIYVYEGNAVAVLDQKCHTLKSGDIFIAFPNQIHYYLNSTIGNYCVVIMSPDLIYDLKNTFNSKLPSQCVINSKDYPEIESIFNKLKNTEEKYYTTAF